MRMRLSLCLLHRKDSNVVHKGGRAFLHHCLPIQKTLSFIPHHPSPLTYHPEGKKTVLRSNAFFCMWLSLTRYTKFLNYRKAKENKKNKTCFYHPEITTTVDILVDFLVFSVCIVTRF
jgi:hypothetical protein